jgi:hypothetical protein
MQQSIVPAPQQSFAWAVPQHQPLGGPAPVIAQFDPFAAPPPPPAPAPAPMAPPMQAAPALMAPPMQAPAPAPMQQQESPYGDFLPAAPPAPTPTPEPARPRPAADVVSSQERQLQQYQGGGGSGNRGSGGNAAPASDSRAMVISPARNPYSTEIARRVPPGASPLPKAELVKKTGYALSRISFRTIVMKKWKQAFWVQYGSHTMLWFRAQEDFKDWLNNPYHTQAQRNFLIKLAVNFVHDLYKPNVRGYQVTQCRVKPYGNKMVRQFKLERWMDYGPTIAAAFGSYDPREVEELRKAIVECMRNTPLDNGIRKTGAVQQQSGEERSPQARYNSAQNDETMGRSPTAGGKFANLLSSQFSTSKPSNFTLFRDIVLHAASACASTSADNSIPFGCVSCRLVG